VPLSISLPEHFLSVTSCGRALQACASAAAQGRALELRAPQLVKAGSPSPNRLCQYTCLSSTHSSVTNSPDLCTSPCDLGACLRLRVSLALDAQGAPHMFAAVTGSQPCAPTQCRASLSCRWQGCPWKGSFHLAHLWPVRFRGPLLCCSVKPHTCGAAPLHCNLCAALQRGHCAYQGRWVLMCCSGRPHLVLVRQVPLGAAQAEASLCAPFHCAALRVLLCRWRLCSRTPHSRSSPSGGSWLRLGKGSGPCLGACSTSVQVHV